MDFFKRYWKMLTSITGTVVMIVAAVIAVESRYAKAENLKKLSDQVTVLNENVIKGNQKQEEVLGAIKTLGLEIQRQSIISEIKSLIGQRESVSKMMTDKPNDSTLQIRYQEICNDLRAAKDRLDKINQIMATNSGP